MSNFLDATADFDAMEDPAVVGADLAWDDNPAVDQEINERRAMAENLDVLRLSRAL